ncbi:MAG: hypothetical protein KN64_05110 [Sulfurovum sp. AS07-7]|nr:MAG: hypothetical protein KN64_05110 [Sulfurovum sp. AS07-7]
MRNKITLSFLTLASILVMSGCSSSTLSPDVAFKESINKTFDAKGYNYSGEVKLDKLMVKADPSSMPLEMKKIESIAKAVTIGFTGAVDSTNAKEEVTYEYKYNKDNVNFSMKIPVLIDYSKQNIYIGNSLLNTFLPENEEYQNKLIKVDLSKDSQLLKDLNMSGDDTGNINKVFSKEWYDKYQKSTKETVNKAFKDINASSFSRDDKNQLVLKLNNEESAKFLTTMVSGIMNGTLKEILPPSEAKELESVTPMIEMMMGMFKNQTQFTTRLDGDGKMSNVDMKFDISDTNSSEFNLGFTSNIAFSNFDKPSFTIDTTTPSKTITLQSLKEIFPSSQNSYKDEYAFEEPTAVTAKPAKKKGSSKRKKSKK